MFLTPIFLYVTNPKEQKEAVKRDAQMWKDVKICVRKKVKKAQKYEHVRWRSKPVWQYGER